MRHHISQIQTKDGFTLFVQEFVPKKQAKAVILLVHGIGEHSSRYFNWARMFVNDAYAVVAFDQRGHGLSSGKRGVISSYNDFMDDIDFLAANISKKFPDLPMVLYGHSMGGGEVLYHLLTRKSNFIGVIATSPWIIAQSSPPDFIIPVLRFLNRLIPGFTTNSKFDTSRLSQNQNVVQAYEDDDFVHHKVSLRLFVDAYDAGKFVLHSDKKINKPLLLMHGNEDEITDSKASRVFAEKNAENCSFKLWENAYHELHNEPFNKDVFSYIVNWLNKLIAQ